MSPYIKTEEKKHYNLDKNPNQQQFNPWSVFPNYMESYYESNPQQPNNYNNAPPTQEPSDYNNYNYQPEEQMPDDYGYDPWSVLPAYKSYPPRERERNRKRPKKGGKKDPSLKYIPAPVIKDNIGKVINTYIPGYGRVNVYIKGITRDGMVHLVILDPQPNDYIYIHNSDMVGIYPPTL
ncbi:hypothetical protein [Vallitalea guaymasensis]|uniref:Uncharacterized protein n=1 Tax=Vallitalea guaymasensis TaxID=1185412 RepID=A0A8J8M8T7_9FIRM|nr:hypothetical protein [Vallitalea guaymasensis]QUH28409.1 hypothetical protein HYG85_05530 [Vallitalea guaymasensis]